MAKKIDNKEKVDINYFQVVNSGKNNHYIMTVNNIPFGEVSGDILPILDINACGDDKKSGTLLSNSLLRLKGLDKIIKIFLVIIYALKGCCSMAAGRYFFTLLQYERPSRHRSGPVTRSLSMSASTCSGVFRRRHLSRKKAGSLWSCKTDFIRPAREAAPSTPGRRSRSACRTP